MRTAWGWRPERTVGIWRYGAGWMRPFVAAAPYLTVGLLLVLMQFLGGTLTSAQGVLFDLPENGLSEGESTELVALVMPTKRDTLVFFDDSRYLMGDAASLRSFGEHLAGRVAGGRSRTLLVLADRRVAGGELMNLAAIARKTGVGKILFAGKRSEAEE